jgi:Ca2+-transporting ATPase
LFDRRTVGLSLLQGLGVLLVTVGVLTWALSRGLPEQDARMLTFCTLVIGDLGLILVNRGRSLSVFTAVWPLNIALAIVLAGALLLLLAVVTVPGLRDLFRFGVVHLDDLGVIVAASVVALVWLDIVGLVRRPSTQTVSSRR